MRIIDFIRRLLGILDPPVPPPPPPSPPPPSPPPSPPPVPDSIESIKQQLLEAHNRERTSRGLSPLTRDARLDVAAQLHNDYMVSRNNLTHSEPSGDIGVRITRQGYVWRRCGENIAEGQRNVGEVMNSWMNSSGHRANILGDFTDVGFGVTKSGNTWWWTTDFAAKR